MLSDTHRVQLDGSAISPALQAERGYRTVCGPDDWQALGCPSIGKTFAHIGLAFPVYRLGTEQPHTWVLRPDNPRSIKGKTIKCEWPKGRVPCFDVLPRYRHALADPHIPIWFTEGAKKADALATVYGEGVVPININGVWGFRGTNAAGGKIVLPDMDEIAWNSRDVVLAFDSDVARSSKVAAALRRLAALLIARGVASVQMLLLPQIGDEKVGVLVTAELPKIRFHDLRHTAATLMLADSVPLVTVSKILGHSSPAITAQIRAHALDESKSIAISGLSQRLKRRPAGTTHTTTHTPTKKQTAPPQRKRGLPHSNAGARGGTRTRTGLPPEVFKTSASAIPPLWHAVCMIP